MQFFKSGKDSSRSDSEIIEAYKASRDPELIALLFDRYSHLVFAVSMKYLKDEEDSKDAVLRIFEKLPGDLVKYDIQNFSSWLHSVTRNDCLHVISSKKYATGTENLAAEAEEEDGFLDGHLPHLDGAIEALNEEQRVCIQMFYIQNYSYQEISEQTGYNMNQVKSYIQNGKRNLKIYLTKKSNER